MTAAATKERASNFHMHSEDAHFTAVPDNTNSPGSQEPRISKTESTAHVSDLTSDKFCRFRPIVQNSVLPRYGSPAIIKHILFATLEVPAGLKYWSLVTGHWSLVTGEMSLTGPYYRCRTRSIKRHGD